METALTEARKALDRGEVPVGCALYTSTGLLLATGSNCTNERGDATAHAELIAMEELAEKFKSSDSTQTNNLTLYVTCEPCVMCAAALVQSRLFSRIEFGCANPRFGGCGSVRPIDINVAGGKGELTHLPVVVGGVRSAECLRLLGEFYTTSNPNAPRPKKRRKD